MNGKGTVDDFIKRVKEMNKAFGSNCNMCEGRMNFILLMDGSGSIGKKDYNIAKQTAEKLVDKFSINSTDIGYILFSYAVNVIFPLKSHLTRDQMKRKIDQSPYPGGGTATQLGIDECVRIIEKADDHTGENIFQ